MVRRYREFQSWLDDVERLWLYAQSTVSKHQTLDAFLAKAESKSKHWKQEAKTGAEKIEQVEKERDKAKQEAKARAEDGLARMRDALVAAEKDRRGLEVEVARLVVERTSLLL